MLDEGPAPKRIAISSSPRPATPTFIQIGKPAGNHNTIRTAGVLLGGLALVAVLVWLAPRDPLPPSASATTAAVETAAASPPLADEAMAKEAMTDGSASLARQNAPAEKSSTDDIVGAEPALPAAPTENELPPPSPVEASARLEKGDTVAGALHELGVAADDVSNAVAALKAHVRLNRLPVGQEIMVRLGPAEQDGKPSLVALSIRPEPKREITLERDKDGDFNVEEEIFETVARLQRASGVVEGSVIVSAEAAGVPRPALIEMLRGFSWDVNFQHDIKNGDHFDVLIEQAWTSDGWPVDAGRVLWAELTTGGGEQSFSMYRFKPRDGEEFFYNDEGESVVKALLRTPLNMSRISSRFGMRHHPVLRFTRLHAGIDFAAPPGTPILAAGAGRVVHAGPNGGYGQWIKISHSDGLATGYAHLSRIAPGVRRSARVKQGQVIGYVGSSGLSTGPHLHFEVHRDGRPVDPLGLARTAMRSRLSGQDFTSFKARVAEIDRARDRTSSGVPSGEPRQ